MPVELKKMYRDIAKVDAGEWVEVRTDTGHFEIRTRGINAAYRDAFNDRSRLAAREANRRLRPGEVTFDANNLPPSIADRISAEMLCEYSLIDVRGLVSDGRELTIDEFKEMLRDPSYQQLLMLALMAQGSVGRDRSADQKATAGNSEQPSAMS